MAETIDEFASRDHFRPTLGSLQVEFRRLQPMMDVPNWEAERHVDDEVFGIDDPLVDEYERAQRP